MSSFYKSVRIKPQTMLSEVYLTGDLAYEGVLLLSTAQQVYDTYDPYLLQFLSDSERDNITLDDARKTELSYLITNAIKMWLQSKKGDYGRNNPNLGGPLDEYIGKSVSQDRANDMAEALTIKIEQTFLTVLALDTITVQPVPKNRMYKIQLTVNYILTNKAFSIQEDFRV